MDYQNQSTGFQVFVDYWNGWDDEKENPLSVLFIQTTPSEMEYRQYKNRMWASYQLDISIYDSRGSFYGRQLISDTLRMNTADLSPGPTQHRLIRLPLDLPVGDYRLMIGVADDCRNVKRVIEKHIQVRGLNRASLTMSEILLAGKVKPDNEKNEAEGISPFPAAVFGANQKALFYYFEVYDNDFAMNDSITYNISVRNLKGKEKLISSGRQKLKEKKVCVFSTLNTAQYAAGEYELIIRLLGKNGNPTMRRRKNFWVYQSPVDLQFKPFSQVLHELRFVATPEELTKLETMPQSQRQAGLNLFWKQKDRTPLTEINETMKEYYQRYACAEARYRRDDSAEGDFTDQGRIFLLYGEPSKIIRQQDPMSSVTLEIWQYSNPAIQIVFEDYSGSGEFFLVRPLTLMKNQKASGLHSF